MGKFIAIVKTVGQLESKSYVQKNLPDLYPQLCVEGESIEELQKEYPDAKVMSVEDYKGYKMALSDLYEEAQASAKQSFWDRLKFW